MVDRAYAIIRRRPAVAGLGRDHGVPQGEDLKVLAQAVFAGGAQLTGPFPGNPEFGADHVEGGILDVVATNRVGLPIRQTAQGVEELAEQVSAFRVVGRARRFRISKIFVEDRSPGFFCGEVSLGGPHLSGGEVEGFGNLDG